MIQSTSPISQQQTSSITSSPAQGAIPSNWKTYHNVQYDFTLHYPSTFTLYETPTRTQTFIPHCNDTSLVTCIFIPANVYNYPNFTGASVEINVVKKDEITSESIKTKTDCNQYFQSRLFDQTKTTTKQINGTTFTYGVSGQGATGHLISEHDYMTFANNACWYVKLSVAHDDVIPPYFTQEDENIVFAQLEQIFSTFKVNTH